MKFNQKLLFGFLLSLVGFSEIAALSEFGIYVASPCFDREEGEGLIRNGAPLVVYF